MPNKYKAKAALTSTAIPTLHTPPPFVLLRRTQRRGLQLWISSPSAGDAVMHKGTVDLLLLITLFWIFSLSLSLLLLQLHNFASVDSVVRWDLQARPPPPLRGHGRRRGGGGGAIPPAEEAAADDDDGSQADATAGADGFRPGGGARAVLPLCW